MDGSDDRGDTALGKKLLAHLSVLVFSALSLSPEEIGSEEVGMCNITLLACFRTLLW